MSTQIKQRIIGGLVLLALLAIFLPLFFNNPHPSATLSNHAPGVPQKPQVQLQLPQIAQAEPAAINQQPAAQQQVAMSEAPQQIAAVTAAAASTPAAKPAAPIAKPDIVAAVKPVVVAKPVPAAVKAVVAATKPVKKHVAAGKAWVVQLASFGSSANAKRLVKKLRQSGYDAYSRHATNSHGKVIYKVYVGPEINRHRIENLQSQLSKHYRLKGMIRRYHV
ncbi:MAG: SPOR domain-containing protein [Coxiellaceae bacterium]|nr:SPOR domain-containing protein [Coxiellaceae bacterium]